jgi:hypothetical protein
MSWLEKLTGQDKTPEGGVESRKFEKSYYFGPYLADVKLPNVDLEHDTPTGTVTKIDALFSRGASALAKEGGTLSIGRNALGCQDGDNYTNQLSRHHGTFVNLGGALYYKLQPDEGTSLTGGISELF